VEGDDRLRAMATPDEMAAMCQRPPTAAGCARTVSNDDLGTAAAGSRVPQARRPELDAGPQGSVKAHSIERDRLPEHSCPLRRPSCCPGPSVLHRARQGRCMN